MPFRNPIVGGETLIRAAIQSEDFVPGVSGWRIQRDGTAEFNNVTVRGLVEAATIIGALIQGGQIQGVQVTGSVISSTDPVEGGIVEFRDGRFILYNDAAEPIGVIQPTADDGVMVLQGVDADPAAEVSRLQLPGTGTSFPVVVSSSEPDMDVALFAHDGDVRLVALQAGRAVDIDAEAVDVDTNGVSIESFANGIGIHALGIGENVEITAPGDFVHLGGDTVRFESNNVTWRDLTSTPYARLRRDTDDSFVLQNLNASSNSAIKVVGQSSASNQDVRSVNGAATAFRAMRASSFDVSSDRKWKRNVRAVPAAVRAALLDAAEPVLYEEADTGLMRIGLVANDLPPEVRSDIPPGTVRRRRPGPASRERVRVTTTAPDGRQVEREVERSVPGEPITEEVPDPLAGAAYSLPSVVAVLVAEIRELRERVAALELAA